MGCDGGSIPLRKEVVKNKAKDECKDPQAELAARWHFCALSGLPLAKPIVSCQLGQLFNKDAVIQFLLEQKAPAAGSSSKPLETNASHIRSLRDVVELKLKDKSDAQAKEREFHGGNDIFRAQFICPISGLTFQGKYKFYYSRTCGCVLSEKALKEVPDDNSCILCGTHRTENDLIVINGNASEVRVLKDRLQESRKASAAIKKSKKNNSRSKNPSQAPDPCKHISDSPRPAKKHKPELPCD